VLRSHDVVTNDKVRPADATNLIFAGSTVAAGRAKAVVYATGTHTEFGQVAHLTATVQRDASTLEVEITRVVHVITAIALSMGIVIFILTNLLVGMEIKESFVFAIGIIVAFVPEGLLPTVSLALAIGVRRMAKRNALVRRLSAVETLSATTVICTDKTGTLTKNEMTVRRLWLPGGELEINGSGYNPTGQVQFTDDAQIPHVKLLLAASALCCNARLNHQSHTWQAIGDPTEAALLVAAIKMKLSLEELQHLAPRVREVPFDSHRRMMSVVVTGNASVQSLFVPDVQPQDSFLVFTKGAPLDVLAQCQSILWHGQTQPMTEVEHAEITNANDELAKRGYRVLGVATKSNGADIVEQSDERLEQDLTFLGLVAMMDPPRPEVTDAIAQCHAAGIRVTMITGDYGLTAEAIANHIGLVSGRARVISGEQLNHLSNAQLRQVLARRQHGLVFARVMPEQKLRLVEAYKALGHIVAVTGDGVNDAPALRAANIGIAMGISGTDVAREAADIVLIDDNFATIVGAIEQGRAVYQNIRKFMTYILSSNVAEFLPFLFMVLFKIPPALVILQILAIDLGTDMVPALALGAELPEGGLMQQPPRVRTQPLLDKRLLLRAYCFLGLLEGALGMAGFFGVWWINGYNLEDLQAITPSILSHSASAVQMGIYYQATTVTLAAIVAGQDGNVFACRSEQVSIFRLGFFSNRLIWFGIATEWLLILSIIYLSPLQSIFSTTALQPIQWLALLVCPPIVLMADELRKRLAHKHITG
jgi:potassium/sodium efflux P-type ATPase